MITNRIFCDLKKTQKHSLFAQIWHNGPNNSLKKEWLWQPIYTLLSNLGEDFTFREKTTFILKYSKEGEQILTRTEPTSRNLHGLRRNSRLLVINDDSETGLLCQFVLGYS
jgi:hypothetical protein